MKELEIDIKDIEYTTEMRCDGGGTCRFIFKCKLELR